MRDVISYWDELNYGNTSTKRKRTVALHVHRALASRTDGYAEKLLSNMMRDGMIKPTNGDRYVFIRSTAARRRDVDRFKTLCEGMVRRLNVCESSPTKGREPYGRYVTLHRVSTILTELEKVVI
jgi:hypothetical protein